jgi:hypothetical protein
MKLLKKTFSKDGFTFTQIKREGRVCIYEQVPDGGEFIAYEVIIIKYKKERQINGKVLPAQEAYPSDSDWGKLAWTLKTLEKAKERFSEKCQEFNKH